MRTTRSPGVLALAATLLLTLAGCDRSQGADPVAVGAMAAPHPTAGASSNAQQDNAPSLRVSQLLEPGAELKPSSLASSLSGARVRLSGFVAEMELPPRGALYLVPQPMHCDEAGGGTADLPPEAVLVTLPPTLKQPSEHVAGLVEAVGVLEVGNRTDEQGRSANFRLRLEAPPVARAL